MTDTTTLYKVDSKGKIRVINFWCEGAEFKQESGVLDGNLVKNSKICKGKNIGRSNETTPEQQAIFDMNSKIREKLQEDYFETIEEAQNTEVILPMLAKKYKDEKKKIDWNNAYIQPKLDGQRCLAICKEDGSVKLISRDGIDIQEEHGSMQHIIDSLSDLKENIILDGELYCHSEEDNFQDIMKAIKKYRPGISEQVKYHVYDIVSDKSFINRNLTIRSTPLKVANIRKLDTFKITSEEEMNEYHGIFLSQGYEGSIIRWGDERYKMNGRSSNLLKYKDFQDNDYLIVDVIPAENRPEWGMIVCQVGDQTFPATPKMTHKEKAELLLNKADYIGQTGIITHFGFTEKGIPRHGIFKGVRLDNRK